jgi:hypothetical protein
MSWSCKIKQITDALASNHIYIERDHINFIIGCIYKDKDFIEQSLSGHPINVRLSQENKELSHELRFLEEKLTKSMDTGKILSDTINQVRLLANTKRIDYYVADILIDSLKGKTKKQG